MDQVGARFGAPLLQLRRSSVGRKATGRARSRQDPNAEKVCGADTCGLPSTRIACLHSGPIKSLEHPAFGAVVFLVPSGTFSQRARSCLSRSRPLPGDGCPLSCWGPCPLNLSTVVLTSQPWLLLSAGVFFFPNLSQMPLWAQWLSLGSLRVKCFSREMERKEPPQRCIFPNAP